MSARQDRHHLEREVDDELRLAESSHPEEEMDEPVASWLFDPADVQEYEAVLRGIRGAAEALDEGTAQDPRPAT